MITEKDWEEFGKKLMVSAAEDAQMTDEEWETILASVPEVNIDDEDDDPETTVAIAMKRA